MHKSVSFESRPRLNLKQMHRLSQVLNKNRPDLGGRKSEMGYTRFMRYSTEGKGDLYNRSFKKMLPCENVGLKDLTFHFRKSVSPKPLAEQESDKLVTPKQCEYSINGTSMMKSNMRMMDYSVHILHDN